MYDLNFMIILYKKTTSFLIFKSQKLKELGANIELAKIGEQKLPDGTTIPLPPLVFGNLGNDPNKKTVLIYGHLDVQPANLVIKIKIIII